MKPARSRLQRKAKTTTSIGKVRRKSARKIEQGVRGSFTTAATCFAHYIRTPLATTLMYLRLIENAVEAALDGELRDGLKAARDEIARLDRLLGHLVDYHRTGRLIVNPTLVDAGAVIGPGVRRMLRTIERNGGDIEVRGRDLVDWWDAGALEQIAQNLVLNAIQHGGRPISVKVDRVGERLRVQVHDAGRRISARLAQRIFRHRPVIRHARADGLGLGLWQVRELAQAHGGSLTLEAAPEGGTAFVATVSPLRSDVHRPIL